MTAVRGRRRPTSRHVSNARARLIISNCAPVPALTFLIIGVTLVFFPTGLWYGYCSLPLGSQPLTRSFYRDTGSAPWNFKWRLCFLSRRKKKNTCILSEFVEKGVVSWLLSAGLGKSFERLRYPLALLTSHLARGDARQTQEGLPAQRTLNSSVRALFTCQDVLLC